MPDNTGLQKKKSEEQSFNVAVSFCPADYEYESHFISSYPDFPKFYDKSLKLKK